MDFEEMDREPSPESDAMTFEVRLTQYNMDGIERSIAEQLAERVIRDHGSNIKALAQEILGQRVNAELEAAIRPIVETALDQPLTRTDPFGKPQGDPKSAKEIIAEGAQVFLEQHIDPNGKVTNDSFWRKSDNKRINRIVSDVIDAKFKKEMDAAIGEIKRQVQAQTKAAAAEWLAKFQDSVADTMKSVR